MPRNRAPASGLFTAVCLSSALLFGTAASADGRRNELRPAASGDDTAQLQAALESCTNPRHPCDLRLGAGVFNTDLLLVHGFVGSITGAGQGRTIIRPVLDRPLRATPLPYVTEPTLDEPYPFLMHFSDNSRLSISRLTFEIPAAMTVEPYDLFYAPQVTNALMAAIAVDGDERAELRMTQTSFVGADNESYFFNNLSFAVIFESQVRFSPEGDMTRRLEHGRVHLSNNRVFRAGNGFMVRTADGVDAFIASNLIDARIYGLFTEDLGASRYTAVRNNISADLDGVALAQTRPPAVPSDYLIAKNRIAVNVEGDQPLEVSNDGVAMYDANPEGAPENIAADVAIWGNDIQLGPNTYMGIAVFNAGAGKVSVVGNRIHGEEPIDTGIWVEKSRGVLIARNEMSGIDPPLGDVALRETARESLVFEPGDSYTDEGVDNVVNGRRGPSSSTTSVEPSASRTPTTSGSKQTAMR